MRPPIEVVITVVIAMAVPTMVLTSMGEVALAGSADEDLAALFAAGGRLEPGPGSAFERGGPAAAPARDGMQGR